VKVSLEATVYLEPPMDVMRLSEAIRAIVRVAQVAPADIRVSTSSTRPRPRVFASWEQEVDTNDFREAVERSRSYMFSAGP
jgi:hypothetical protein